jgi:phage portal protein BeeE
MPEPFRKRLKHAWNAFLNKDPTLPDSVTGYYTSGYSSTTKPDRRRLRSSNERSIITSIYNRIALDVAAISVQHVRLDQNGRYIETIPSELNNCLTLNPNLDQTGRSFMQDVVMSLFDEGCVAIIPIDTTLNPLITGS